MQVIIKLGCFFLNIVYFMFKLLPTQNKIVMISRQSNEPSIDFVLLKKAIEKENHHVTVKFLCHTLDGGVKSKITDKIKYFFHMFVQMKEIATSKVVILDTYCIVASLLHHKKDLKIIQMWHSMGTMKKFGYSILDKKEGSQSKIAKSMRMHEQYSYVLASSPAYQSHLASGFNCSESIVKIFPLPRVDLLKSKSYKNEIREKIFTKYPKLNGKQIVVYCPTFRKNEEDMQLAVNRLSESIQKNQILVLKLHPLSKVMIQNEKVMFLSEFSSFECLFIADAVISDYSCIIYEAAVLNIPLYFFNFDMNQYVDVRGLAIDYEKELPGLISKDASKIMNAIAFEKYDMNKLKEFCDKYVVYKGSTSQNIALFVLALMKEKVY